MPNSKTFLNDLELEKHIKDMDSRQLMEFTARQVYDVCSLVTKHERRINYLEKQSNKVTGVIGGIGTFIGAVTVGVINYFINK